MPPRVKRSIESDILVEYDPEKDGVGEMIEKQFLEEIKTQETLTANETPINQQETITIETKEDNNNDANNDESNSTTSTQSSLDFVTHNYKSLLDSQTGKKMMLIPEREFDFLQELRSEGFSYEPGDSEFEVTQKYLRNEHFNEIRRGLNSMTTKKTNELKAQMMQFTTQADQQCIVAVNEKHQEKGKVTFSLYYPTPKPRLTKNNLKHVIHSTVEKNFKQMDSIKRTLLSKQMVESMWQSSANGGAIGPALNVQFEHKMQLKAAKQQAKAQGIPFVNTGLYGVDYENDDDDDIDVRIVPPTQVPQSPRVIESSPINRKRTNSFPTTITTIAAPLIRRQETIHRVPPSKMPRLNPLPSLPPLSSFINSSHLE